MVAEATSVLLSVLSSQQGVRLTLHNVAFFGFRFTFVWCHNIYASSKKKKKKDAGLRLVTQVRKAKKQLLASTTEK